MTDTRSLQIVYLQALQSASKAYYLPSIQQDTQNIVQKAIADLDVVQSRIQNLHLFSPNETLDEISTKDLLYLTVPFIVAELEFGSVAARRQERLARLRKALACLMTFTSILKSYEMIPEDEVRLYSQRASTTDPGARREMKITQFKKQKEIKQTISGLREHRGLTDIDVTNNYDLVAALLVPAPSAGSEGEEDEYLRNALLLCLRLQWTQACTNLESIRQEIDLLENAPPEEPSLNQSRSPQGTEDSSWRLDAPSTSLTSPHGPVLDVSGKPLRPFTILPAGAGDRARLQNEVFRADYRLPTMTIDEYLVEEQRRGNIITGGGPQSETKLTKSEQLALDAEMDGALVGDEKVETKRREDENWAQFTDENPRGAGNTMNRG